MKSFNTPGIYGNLPACALLAAACLLLAGSAVANTVPVTNLNDSGPGSLRQVITEVAPGGTVDLTGLAGTIALTSGELDIGSDLTITGPGAKILAISGNNSSRVFNVSANVNISGLTITAGLVIGNNSSGESNGGDGQGGGILNSDNLTLNNCVISGNSVFGGESLSGNGGDCDGGGIYNEGTLSLSDCTVCGNSAIGGSSFSGHGGDGDGGGIYSLFNLKCTIARYHRTMQRAPHFQEPPARILGLVMAVPSIV